MQLTALGSSLWLHINFNFVYYWKIRNHIMFSVLKGVHPVQTFKCFSFVIKECVSNKIQSVSNKIQNAK